MLAVKKSAVLVVALMLLLSLECVNVQNHVCVGVSSHQYRFLLHY